MVTEQAPVTLELRNTPGEKTQSKPKKVVHAYITADAFHASTRNIYKRNRESAYDVPGPYWCIRLTTRAWKTNYTACHPRKTTTYILHVIPITTHTHDRRKSLEKKETKKRKEYKGKKIRAEKRKTKKEREGKKSKHKKKKTENRKNKSKKRQNKKRKQGKEKRKESCY